MAKTKGAAIVKVETVEKPVRAIQADRVESVSPNYVSIYSNDIQMQTTPWDIRLRLGQIDNVDAKAGKAFITVLADVRLSPQHAKKLSEVLQRQLESYEQTIGPIPQPQD